MDGDTPETKVLIDQDPQTMADAEKLPELRIVLFGRTGVGKSTLGDIIIGKKNAFTTKGIARVCTEKCHVEKNTNNVVVVDTPALKKKRQKGKDLVPEIRRSIDLAKPGPHVFLLVEILHELIDEELDTLEVFERAFGKHAMAYAMVVFTHDEEDAEEATIKKWIDEYKLKKLLEPCHGRHFFFYIENTTDEQDKHATQVTELLKMIRQAGTEYYYTPEMLKEHEEAEKEEAEKKRKQEQQGNNPKPAEAQNKTMFLEKSGLIGIIVGCGLGYFLGGGELNSTSGALLGAVAGMILSMGTTALGMKAKMLFDNCCKT